MIYGYTHRKQRKRLLSRAFHECERCARPDQPSGLRSILELAHLLAPGHPAYGEDENAAILCALCHHAQDRDSWLKQFTAYLQRRAEERKDRKDAGRPILAALASEEAIREQRCEYGAEVRLRPAAPLHGPESQEGGRASDR